VCGHSLPDRFIEFSVNRDTWRVINPVQFDDRQGAVRGGWLHLVGKANRE
jgi:hypothetical protein